MYSIEKLRRGIKTPSLIGRELNKQYHTRLGRHTYNVDGIDIFAKDWDILLILDACRYDMFAEHHPFRSSLQKVESRGSSTAEFLRGNFDGRDLHDTVYVTANPQLYRLRELIDVEFHDESHVWREEGWDSAYGTVLPDTTKNYALQADKTYPQKRIIVHFLQPHYPFLTDESDFDKEYINTPELKQGDFWAQQMEGLINVSTDTIWRLYRENLLKVFPAVSELIEEMDGRAVVTSDHGNMIGERSKPIPIQEWGHPENQYTKQLIEVPWLAIEGDERRNTIAETPKISETENISDDIVSDRLSDLGYI